MKLRLQTKYTLSITAVILLVTLALAITLDLESRKTTVRMIGAALHVLDAGNQTDYVADAMELTTLLAEGLAEPMATGNDQQVERLLRTIAKGRHFAYAVAVDRLGHVYRTGAPDDAPAPRLGGAPEVARHGDILTVSLPVQGGSGVLGSVRVGFSPVFLRAVHQQMKGEMGELRSESARDQRIAIAVVLAILTLAGAIIAGIMARRLSRPIRALALSARTFAAGDRNAPSPRAGGNDEVAELAEAFSTMRETLGRTTVSQTFLRCIIDSLNEGLIVASARGEIRLANRAVMQMFGYPIEDLKGRPFSSLVAHPRKFAIVAAAERQVSECWFLHRDGRLMPVAVSRSRLGEGADADQVYVMRDIAERKRLEDELWLYRSRLEQLVVERTKELTAAIQELESFSYSVSHDLHAPLRAINGFGAALREDYYDVLDDGGRGYLDRISKATVRMGLLIDGLLTLSRVVRIEIRKDDVDLSTLASEVAGEIAAAESPHQVTFRIAPKLKVQGDPALLRLLLQNLFSNAWKFTKKTNSALIEFGSTLVDDQAVLFVRDNGIGFDPSLAQRLFQPFQRLHDADDFPGTGVGLATAQRIIQRHGGRIWVDAEPGAGATFYFLLPKEAEGQVEERRVSGLMPLS